MCAARRHNADAGLAAPCVTAVPSVVIVVLLEVVLFLFRFLPLQRQRRRTQRSDGWSCVCGVLQTVPKLITNSSVSDVLLLRHAWRVSASVDTT